VIPNRSHRQLPELTLLSELGELRSLLNVVLPELELMLDGLDA